MSPSVAAEAGAQFARFKRIFLIKIALNQPCKSYQVSLLLIVHWMAWYRPSILVTVF
jgi:hypothetical protein